MIYFDNFSIEQQLLETAVIFKHQPKKRIVAQISVLFACNYLTHILLYARTELNSRTQINCLVTIFRIQDIKIYCKNPLFFDNFSVK